MLVRRAIRDCTAGFSFFSKSLMVDAWSQTDSNSGGTGEVSGSETGETLLNTVPGQG